MRNITINGDKLKADLLDYFGTAMFAASPMVMMELSKVENASGNDLIQIALDNGFDLEKYEL
jgi:hypothetical protein